MIEERIRNVYVDVEDMTYQAVCIENLSDETFTAYFHDKRMDVIFSVSGWLDEKERKCQEAAIEYYREHDC